MMTASPPVAKIAILRLSVLLLMCVALLAVIVFVTDGVEGWTITVDDDGEGDYERIQDAIDAAEDGDTVRVWEGVYYENVVVNKSVDLIGNRSETTTIDGGGKGDVVNITADWVNMSEFTVSGSYWLGSGIKVESGNNHILRNNCSNNGNYGIYLRDSSNCTLDNNTCENNRSGISLSTSSDCKITQNTCSENNNYGISLYRSSDCKIENNTCSANNDHGIYLKDSSNCTLDNNTCSANNDYGICLDDSDDSTITNNTCSNNDYGIILWDSSNCTIMHNTISDNRVGINLRLLSRDNTAHYNIINNNTGCGIDASRNNNYVINATYNWWGHEAGPYHPTENPDGTGDNVTDNVKFEPWLETDDIYHPEVQDSNDDDFTILGMNGYIFLGLLGALLLLFSLLFVFMGRSPREKGKPPVGKEESGGVDEGRQE